MTQYIVQYCAPSYIPEASWMAGERRFASLAELASWLVENQPVLVTSIVARET